MRYKFHYLPLVLLFAFLLSNCYLRPSDSPPWNEANIPSSEMKYHSLSDTTYSHKSNFEYWDILSDQGRMYYDAMWNFQFQEPGTYQTNLYQFYPANLFNYRTYCEVLTLFYLDHPERELTSLQNMSATFISSYENNCNWGLSSSIEKTDYLEKMNAITLETNFFIYQVKQEPVKYEKYKMIHDWIVSNVHYDYDTYDKLLFDTPEKEINPNSSNIYGAIVNKLAVCDGISDAFKYLCDQCELECISIRGQFQDTPSINNKAVAHQWNLVYDEKWYLVDCTFDLYSPTHYDFFMVDLLVDDRIPNYDLNDFLKNDS